MDGFQATAATTTATRTPDDIVVDLDDVPDAMLAGFGRPEGWPA